MLSTLMTTENCPTSAPFFGFMGVTSALVFANIGAGTWAQWFQFHTAAVVFEGLQRGCEECRLEVLGGGVVSGLGERVGDQGWGWWGLGHGGRHQEDSWRAGSRRTLRHTPDDSRSVIAARSKLGSGKARAAPRASAAGAFMQPAADKAERDKSASAS